MKLLLGLFFSSLFCSVYTLQCLQCQGASGQCSTTASAQCITGTACGALRANVEGLGLGGTTSVQRSCILKDVCTQLNAGDAGITYSANVGIGSLFAFVSCCETNNCNSKNIAEPDNTPNGLKCPSCNSLTDTTCNTTVSCVGNQDRCATASVTNLSVFGIVANISVKGCVSTSFCDTTQFGQISCCKGHMCNGSDAWLRLDFSLFLTVLVATMLLQ